MQLHNSLLKRVTEHRAPAQPMPHRAPWFPKAILMSQWWVRGVEGQDGEGRRPSKTKVIHKVTSAWSCRGPLENTLQGCPNKRQRSWAMIFQHLLTVCYGPPQEQVRSQALLASCAWECACTQAKGFQEPGRAGRGTAAWPVGGNVGCGLVESPRLTHCMTLYKCANLFPPLSNGIIVLPTPESCWEE